MLGLGLAGCTQLPVDGPAYRDIHTGATTSLSTTRDGLIYTARDAVDFQYALVDISPAVVQVLSTISPDSLFRTFRAPHGPVPVVKVGVGDVLQTSIFESSSGGLFVPGDASNRSGNYVTLPPQAVASNGMITIPYAGGVKAAGRTVPEIQHDIESKLAGRAIEPQVVINIVEQNADSVTVIGDAGSNKFKLTGSGERILDVISKAGAGGGGAAGASGVGFAGYDLYVTLQRKKQTATIPFTSLIEDPQENIYVVPGDIVYVYRQPRTFIAMGAVASIGGGGSVIQQGQTTGVSGQFRFEQPRLNLNEAIAKAGGLTDSRANPAQVFLYRAERRDILGRMGVDLSKFPPQQAIIPTVYRANYRDPSSFFFGQRFLVRDKDLIYVANAGANEIGKFLGYVNAWTSTASSAMISGRTIGDISWGAHVLTNTTATVVAP